MPATISPITAGCPIFLNKKPNSLAKAIITIICKSKTASGSVRLWLNEPVKI
jgi:hypothetical protein